MTGCTYFWSEILFCCRRRFVGDIIVEAVSLKLDASSESLFISLEILSHLSDWTLIVMYYDFIDGSLFGGILYKRVFFCLLSLSTARNIRLVLV